MGLLKKEIKSVKAAIDKATKPGGVSETMFVTTGIDAVDYHCGTIGTNVDEGDQFYNLGIPMGKIHMAVGHSQSGKTTLMLQIAFAICAPLNGDVIVADFERASTDPRSRIKAITGCSDEQYEDIFTIFNQEDMTVEFLKEQVYNIAEMKRATAKEDMLDWITLEGRACKIYPPTVIIIDSVAAMRTKELLENSKMDTNMVAATIAKGNSAFLTSVEHLLEAYNITILAVGHITTKITINPYAPKKIQLPGLGDDENIAGGNKFVFLASYLFKLNAGKEFKDDKDLGIQGRIVYCSFLKTRSSYNKQSVPLFYHAKEGFSNTLTSYYHFKETLGCLKKSGTNFALPNAPTDFFAQKGFMAKYNGDEEFNANFNSLVAEKYAEVLASKNSSIDESNVDRNSMSSEFEE